MSRWSKRSDEEKEAIAKKQEAERYKASPQYQQDLENSIVESAFVCGMIPMRCNHCFKMSMAKEYTLTTDRDPLGLLDPTRKKLVTMINGECMWCHKPMKRAYPQSFSMDELVIATATLAELTMKGKLKDLR